MSQNLHKSVYIPSVEASDLYSHMFRNKEIEIKYVGMIPSSLELNKLISIGMKARKNKTSDKLLSDDIFNVKFRQKVRSADDIIGILEKKTEIIQTDSDNIEKNEKAKNYKQKLRDFTEQVKENRKLEAWREINSNKLRMILYSDGFEYNGFKYVVYKRSSAKSRVGQCLFIKESLYQEMISWSQMNLNLVGSRIDVPSLLAYQSLVGSSLENTVVISPNNILIVDDVESIFKRMCNAVQIGNNDKFLDSITEEVKIKNSLFDGESLLDSSYFPKEKSMMLLRNHMFKSAAFNCNIQDFFKDYFFKNFPDGNYDDWKIPTLFEGEMMSAKDVHLIITPSSLKALKFSHTVSKSTDNKEQQKEMWQYWKNFISSEGNIFGVCKSEKSSKYGNDENGCVLQQTSYQMINSMPIPQKEMHSLVTYENHYLEKLKNDDYFFIEHIGRSANSVNSNEMFVDIFKNNKDIVHTKLFRKFRTEEINRHLTHVKNGKLRLHGDYCTLLGNPMEFLLHSIGKFDINRAVSTLKENEVYTTLFAFNKEIVGFRNPHTSPSNVLVVKNTYNADIEKYFNLTNNVVCVNAIEFPLQDILSGSDYDSDTIVLFDNSGLLEIAKKCFGKYNVCINKVNSSKIEYQLTKNDMAIIDNQLATSQKNIGRVVNLGQLCMSTYWDLLSKGISELELLPLLKKIDVMTVLSGICIDLAKKLYDVDIKKEIDHVAKTKQLKKDKPLFWRYVSQNEKIKTTKYECPMDFLYHEMKNIENAKHHEDIPLHELLVERKLKDGDRKQQKKIRDYVYKMSKLIKHINSKNLIEDEKKKAIEQSVKYYEYFVGKLSVNPETMFSLLLSVAKNKNDNIATKMISVLHRTHKDVFINSFLSKNSTFY